MSTYNFQASHGYHVYKETTWSNAKVNEKVKIEIEINQRSIAIDPYACAVRERQQLGFVTLNDNLAVSGWVGLAYDEKLRKDIIS